MASNASSPVDSARSTMEKLLRNEIQTKDVPEVKYMEQLKEEGRKSLEMTTFDSQREHDLAVCVQNNVNGFVDTAVNCLNIATHIGMIATKYLIPDTDAGLPLEVINHGRAIIENTKQIYFRATEQAISSSYVLLDAVKVNENTRRDPSVQQAALQYKTDVNRYRAGSVDPNVPKQGHTQLVEAIEKAEPDPNTPVRKAAERSSLFWKVAAGIGLFVLLVAAAAVGAKK